MNARGGIALRDYTQGGSPPRWFRSITPDQLGRTLIYASLGLGLLEAIIPRRMQKLAGVRGDHAWLVRAAGLRELMHGLLIFMQPRPRTGILSRLVGDAMDLGLLGAAFTFPKNKKGRLGAVTGVVAGITALDALAAVQLNRQRKEERSYSTITQADLDGRTGGNSFHVTRTVTIDASPETLYNFWHDFENLPRFMYHLEDVQVLDGRRSHWVAKAIAGRTVEWDAEMTDDQPNELIAWRSTDNADVPNAGVVRFYPAPGDRGTVVHVEIEYRMPGGPLGRIAAMMFGQEPGQQVAGDLRRFKQVIETGEVIRSDASPEGTGQAPFRKAQPLPQESRGQEYGEPQREEWMAH